MKTIVILVLLSTMLCEDSLATTLELTEKHDPSITDGYSTLENSAPQRELTQILVEEEKKPKKKASPAPKQQKKPVDKHTIYLKQIDGMIKNFGFDQKLDKKKVGNYFKKLEDKIYNSLRRSLFKQRKYMQSYEGVIRHYKDIAEKYNIK